MMQRNIATLLLLALLPAAVFAGLEAFGILRVIVTGMCPSHAPDIPAMPCSVSQSFERGGFLDFGRMIVVAFSAIWFVAVILIGWCVAFFRTIFTRKT